MSSRIKLIACRVVVEELLPLLPEGVETETLDFGLHRQPDRLRAALQDAVDAVPEDLDAVVLGYGLCSKAVVGIRAGRCPVVIPRVDDCIGIFLGSREAHRLQSAAAPGTYYLTKGWVEAGDGPFAEYEHMVERWGAERAERLTRAMLKHYTRLAFIRTGPRDALEPYRTYAARVAKRFDLRYEELEGSTALVERMVRGPWDHRFVVVPPGETASFEDFWPDPAPAQALPIEETPVS